MEMFIMTENNDLTIPGMGGAVVLAAACKFQGQDRMTGAPQEVELPDRVVVVYGKKKATLCGGQCKLIHDLFKSNKDFRDWCEHS
jgi:hypothetical protein